MTSNTTTGERRWASGRRGGMTVLGKVPVPKPINLPSQRLENHGLDPNVEIVPKGTLGWGSKSSAGTNAWSTSSLSPSTDGSRSSHGQLAGRPLSGDGTRPSTAGSEINYDSNVNGWSSNSRPSSASGSSTSNKVLLASLRPRSAETRPGSSQLSRFAEPSLESGAWGSDATSERIGLGNSGKDGFSLSSRDFPTLGSEKDELRTNTEPLDGIPRNADSKNSSWREDGPSYENGPRSGTKRSNEEPHPYRNPNSAPHYESWHGAPPLNPAGPMWFRGPPGPLPYGPPGDFPMKSFPYYPPPVPAPSLANSHVVPARGVGPHGHHATNGDMYRPHMPQSYMHPGILVRPGFYPPPVPYEGYYGPSMGLCNPVPTGHPVYNRPVGLNVPDLKHSHFRPGEVGPPDHADTCHPHDPRDNVLRKQSDRWSQNDEERSGHKGRYASNQEKGILSKAPIQDNLWGEDDKKDEDMHFEKNAPAEKSYTRSIKHEFGSSIPANVMISGGVSNVEDTDSTSVIENVHSPADHSLIQKIEGLNAKARYPGGIHDGSDEQLDGMQFVNSKANQSAIDANLNIVLERHHPSGVLVPVSHDINISPVDRSHETTVPFVTATSRKLAHGAQSRSNHGKVSFNGKEADGWRKRSESHAVVSPADLGSNIKNQVVGHHALYPSEVLESNVQKGEEESGIPSFDLSDTQRAKMKEIAKQRALQLQKEEEDRIRDQKAKALAKLAELNWRSANQAEENPGCKLDSVSSHNATPLKQDGPRSHIELRFGTNDFTNTIFGSAANFVPKNEIGAGDTSSSAVLSVQPRVDTVKTTFQDSSSSQNQLPKSDVNIDNAANQRISTPVHEALRQKQVGNKQRQNFPREKNSTLESIPAVRTDVTKDHTDSNGCEGVAGGVVASGAGKELAESPDILFLPVHQKKNKSGKNKNKLEELPTTVPNDPNITEAISGTEEYNISNLNMKSSSIQSTTAKDVTHTSESLSSLSHEDVHARQNNLWKPQHSRKPRSSQGNRSEKSHNSDAVVWAPVRPHNKVEATDQTFQKAVDEPSALSVTGDTVVNSSPKIKRAEMERYVPKPVAKESVQKGSIQQSKVVNNLPKVGSSMDSKHVDGKHKQRAQGSRSQLVVAESVSVQVSYDIETPNGSGKNVKSDETLARGPPSRSDHELPMKGPKVCDGWNSPNDSDFSLSDAFVGGKDNVHPGRGKRHSFKGHKGIDSNLNSDRKGSKAGSNDLPHPPIVTSQTETTMLSKESRAVGDRATSQWKPKAQGFVGPDLQGNRSHNHQNPVAEGTNKAMKRETGHSGASHKLSRHNHGVVRDPMASEATDVGGEISSLGHHENKMDKLVSSVQGPAASSNMGFVGEVASGPFNVAEGHNEQRPSSGYRKNANHNGRFNKGPESREDCNPTGQENMRHYLSGNRERQRPNAHFEYQPVDSYNRYRSQPNDHGTQTENQSGGMKFRGRGQSHARRGRGNFYGRQRAIPANSGNE